MSKRLFYWLPAMIALSLFLSSEAFCAAAKKESRNDLPKMPVLLEADDATYDELQSLAVAEGHAVMRYTGIVLRADRITLDPATSTVKAYANEGKRVSIRQGSADVLEGSYLEYRLTDSTGYMTEPDGRSKVINGSVYAKGRQLEFAAPEDAHQKKWIHGRYLKNANENDLVLKWNNSTYTSCKEDSPHYHLSSKKISMLPGRYIILHTPRVYVASTYLFTMPFNIAVNQKRTKRTVVTVLPNYDRDKHAGVEASTSFNWNTGKLDLKVGSWAAGITEYQVRFDQRITDWMSVYAGDNYIYDDDLRKTESRPIWGAYFSKAEWDMEVGWAQREKRSVVRKPGQKEYETTLWRDPEIKLTSPWVSLHTGSLSQYARVKGNWGRFQETGSNALAHTGFIERYGWGVDYYTEYPFRLGAWRITPFLKGDYWNYGYKNDASYRQIVSKLTYGYRASQGDFEIGSAFEQKRVSGRTAFRGGWDSNSDTDTFYQRVGFKFAKNFSFSVQGIWEMSEGDPHDLTSVAYTLSYNNHCCVTWSLTYNDDCTDDDDENWTTFSIAINAFPDARYKVGSKSVTNPFSRPSKLHERPRQYAPTMMEQGPYSDDEGNDIHMPSFDI